MKVGIFDPEKITLREAAKLLGKQPRTMYDWLDRGLPAVKIGGTWMTTRPAIEKWLAGDDSE
jgi:excisionase family DNA binding protein|tara:strand:+ start:4382 stop:4567 length:186 start_codon:yes stop_codon:yes gene_type:complete